MTAARPLSTALFFALAAPAAAAQQLPAQVPWRADGAADTTPSITDTLPPAADTLPAATEGVPDLRPAQRQVTLQEAIEIARRKNPTLRRARAQVDAAESDRLSALGEFLPDISLGYGYTNASTGRLDPTGQAITRTSYTMQLGATYDLFTGLRRVNDLESSRLQVRAEEADYQRQVYEVVEEVKRAYFNAVANREVVRVELDRVRRQRDQLEFVRNQLELGRATRSDVLRSRVELNDARLALINARNSARASTFELGRVLGFSGRVGPVPEARLRTDSLAYGRQELTRMALQSGPTVEAAEASARVSRAAVDASKSGFLPTLTFQGGWAWQNSDFPPQNRSWSLGLRGQLPLFNGFNREASVYRAEAQARAAEAQADAAALALRADVDDAYSQVRSARAGIRLAQQSVELARENLEVSRERFRLGLATILDLQTAQIDLEQAQVELIQRRFDRRMGIARLETLAGRSLTGGPSGSGSTTAEPDPR